MTTVAGGMVVDRGEGDADAVDGGAVPADAGTTVEMLEEEVDDDG